MANVAQLVRALVCGSGGRGFKPHRSPQIKYPTRWWDIFCIVLFGYCFDIGTKLIEAICKIFVPAVDAINVAQYRSTRGC